MSTFDSIKMRGERLKKMMDDTLQPDKAWESIHPHHSPPKKYPNPNFLTNPDVNDPRNFTENGGNHLEGDSDDFYEYLTDEDEEGKEERKDGKQHAIDEAYLARLRELEKKKKLDEIRDKINNDADHNFTKYQINKTRTIDPFEKSEEPLVLQLYLRIYGGYFMNPRDITLLQDTEQRLSQMNVFRNSFVQYKDFPKGRLQRTTTELQSNNPIYNHKAYFPVLVRPDIIEKLAKFNFLFEVRDQVTTDDTPIIGFTKLSLSSFFKSLVSEDNGYLNTSHFDEAANQYPMVGFDDRADIMDFNGKCVGWLQITMALGSPEQINFFDRIQQERDKAREEEEEERRRMDRRKKKKDLDEDSDSVRDKQMEDLLRELIDTIKDKSTSSSSKRERGKWEDNHLDSLHKLFEECRLEGTKDIKMKVFADSKDKNSFENDLLDNTTLNRKSVNNILQIWNYGNGYDIKQLQESYNAYCRYCTHAEGKVKSIFEKLQVFFDIHDDQNKRKPRRQEDEEIEKKNLAAKWCKDKEMREGFNLIIDLFQGHGDPDQSINMEEFLKFLKTPPFVGKEHICLSAMKQEILTEKVVLDHKKDFNHGIADSVLEAGQRDDYLYDPIKALDYQNSCAENDIPITIWEIF